MNFEKFLTYVTHHSESIIQWLFFIIMGLAALVIARQVFGRKQEDGGHSLDTHAAPMSGDIQNVLQRILEQTKKLESVSLEKMTQSAAVAGAPPEIAAQVEQMKKEIAAREEEINKLKAAPAVAGSVVGGGNLDAQLARIKELEAKLEEYSILEDDIADLSLYKEENARLKADVERLQNSAPAGSAVPAAAPPPTEDLVAEFAQAVGQEAIADVAAVAPVSSLPKTDDPMADFAKTVELEKAASSESASATVAPTPAVAVETPPATPAAAVAASPASGSGESTDLFAEFEKAAAEESDEGAGNGESDSLDTDKMMAEMAALVTMEAAADGSSALDESVNTDKMVEEANSLTKSS